MKLQTIQTKILVGLYLRNTQANCQVYMEMQKTKKIQDNLDKTEV